MVVFGNRSWICALSDFSVGVRSLFCFASLKTNVDSSDGNKGVKRRKVTGIWVVTACVLIGVDVSAVIVRYFVQGSSKFFRSFDILVFQYAASLIKVT
jgi:hypothetical protein